MNRFATASLGTALAITSMLPLSGCIYGRSSSSVSGNYVGGSTFNKIEIGLTDENWVKSALGAPSRQTTLSDGGTLWTYSYSRSEESRGTFLWVVGGSSREQSQGATHIEFDPDGIVRDKWRD